MLYEVQLSNRRLQLQPASQPSSNFQQRLEQQQHLPFVGFWCCRSNLVWHCLKMRSSFQGGWRHPRIAGAAAAEQHNELTPVSARSAADRRMQMQMMRIIRIRSSNVVMPFVVVLQRRWLRNLDWYICKVVSWSKMMDYVGQIVKIPKKNIRIALTLLLLRTNFRHFC